MSIENFFIIFSVAAFIVLFLIGVVYEIIQRLKNKKIYYKWLEDENARLTRTVEFYRLQEEIK